MKIKNIFQILSLLTILIMLYNCGKKEEYYKGKYNPEEIIKYNNDGSPIGKMDSLQAIDYITKQKLTEVYELSALANVQAKDSILENILMSQIKAYFLPNDSMNIKLLLKEMDSLQVHYTTVKNFNFIANDTVTPDSIGHIQYTIDYYSKNKKLIQSSNRTANFILKKDPKILKGEFKFYFSSINDTIPLGVTR